MAPAPLLGVLGTVCEATARVAEQEVARQAQAAVEYERWILKALSSENCGPHWMPCVDRELKPTAPSMSRVMQQFLALCQDCPEKLVASPRLSQEPDVAGPLVLSDEEQVEVAQEECSPAPSPVEVSPLRRPGSFKLQAASPLGSAPASEKLPRKKASPLSERIAQAPSPIRALCLGPLATSGAEASLPSAPPLGPAAAACYAQDSIIEPTEEVQVPRPADLQSKTLFARPPDSPTRPERVRPKPVLEVPPVSPERKELTPMKVADRIMMFEKITSPSVRGAMSSSARLGKALTSRGSACSTDRSSGRAVDGSSLFTPLQPAWARPDVKPKELFRSNSDLNLKRPEVPRPKRKVGPPPTRAVHGLHGHVLQPRQKDENQKEKKVPMPMYRDPALDVRAMVLPPKEPSENYAISEGGDSENEDAAEREKLRQKKAIPKWCETYLQKIQGQEAVDPDTIFGRVPRFVMDDVFSEQLYTQVGKKRPARRRGSSGDWRRDRLTRSEIRSYKQRMGQKRSWDEPMGSVPPA